MLKKINIFPIAFGFVLTLFTAYSVLDTFVIPHPESAPSYNSNFFNSSSTSSSSINESSINSSSSVSSEENKSSSESSSNISISTSDSSNSVSTSSSESSSVSSIEVPPVNYFTEETIITDELYSDQNLHIEFGKETIQVKNYQNKDTDTVVFYADVRIKSLSNLKTDIAVNAQGKYGKNISEKTSVIAKRNEAVLAINGDFCYAQEAGYVLRNGTILRDKAKSGNEDLAIYKDGSFETFYEKDYTLNQIAEKGAYQVLSFGPALVKNSEIAVKTDSEVAISSHTLGNQRCSIGYFEPLHYFVMVCDGRIAANNNKRYPQSFGMSLYEAATYMKNKGCKVAYNLDGGGSATFYYNGKVLNHPTEDGYRFTERAVSDIVYFK